MKDALSVQDYLLHESEVGDWDGEEELVTDKINSIIHTVWDALPDDLATEHIERIMPQLWQQLGQDTLLLDVDEHELAGWALVFMRQQIELGIEDAEADDTADANIRAEDEEE
ncbi:hypothetical protein [Arsukibacterium sp.]|uniref:hypothetical protein n=1 Tax=Arsukibacterium sp. TaxID=1977258 RepID=UPI00299DD5D6|nr:hypothetical protein [Arsukibacterium sp.]MDX1677509.1 hypothetical protein [Arsukibacterium sp.]